MYHPKIRLTPTNLSFLFWDQAFINAISITPNIVAEIQEYKIKADKLRTQADYNTGSINLVSSLTLFALTAYFKPEPIAEVGTFIGNSTNAIAKGMQVSGSKGNIYTCDYSNDITLDWNYEHIGLHQFKKQSSEQLFTQLKNNDIKPDMFFLDGRVTPNDVGILKDLIRTDSIIAFDDFEGMEKGVANLFQLYDLVAPMGQILVNSPMPKLFGIFNIPEVAITTLPFAMMVPIKSLQYFRQ